MQPFLVLVQLHLAEETLKVSFNTPGECQRNETLITIKFS